MEDILEWYKEEGLIFRDGSGAGTNLSRIRASNEPLGAGGKASGPVSFMRGADASAGAIKSGGACLAPWQYVYTETGPRRVDELSKEDEFIAISYHPPAGRFAPKRAWAWHSGYKELVKITTDKGEFYLSTDHPVRLAHGEYVAAGNLANGQSIHRCTIDEDVDGDYSRLRVVQGKNDKEYLHRLIADKFIDDIEGMSVHHENDDPTDNSVDNLKVIHQSDHAKLHMDKLVENNQHVFQRTRFDHNGKNNGMHSDSEFWSNDEKVEQYKEKQRQHILRRDPSSMQHNAATIRMINYAYKLINNGYDISTFDNYYESRKHFTNNGIGMGKTALLQRFEERFGSYEDFLKELEANNHRVVSVESIGESDVYDVEVECDTLDDKTPETGHNFVIWPHNDYTGSGIVIANTRRAAKLLCLDDDHPDVEEFIWCKAHEEKKAHALAEAGFDMSFDGADVFSVQYQNANNSVRFSNKFMEAYENDDEWHLVNRRDGTVAKTVRARDLFRQVADAAWQSADPGVQFDDTINDWHTTPQAGRINASNPCGEYNHLDNSSCNLASLNLRKFVTEDGALDIHKYRHVTRIIFIAQDILISGSVQPTEQIQRNTKDYRQIGIGYTNLGGMLMELGLPYDSDDGRLAAAQVTALLTGESYRTSTQLARRVGPFKDYFEKHKDDTVRVLSKHANAFDRFENESYDQGSQSFVNGEEVSEITLNVWNETIVDAEEVGVRNAQASVIAPAGTISFFLDADTLGLEPDFSLIKYKQLVGGGMMEMVNNTVPIALERLGYSHTQIQEIQNHIYDNSGSIKNAPHIKHRPEHLKVFECAVGDMPIRPYGHIHMMAAIQPFVSGSMSKTVNLPEETTVDDILRVYYDGWKLGLKAIAIYRDGSKFQQPLSSKKQEEKSEPESTQDSKPESQEKSGRPVLERQKLPRTRNSKTTKFTVGTSEGYLTTGEYPNGDVGEIFVKLGKQGSTLAGFMDALAVSISIGLQHGVPLKEYVNKFVNVKFEPAGLTDDPDIRFSSSLIDYIFKRLAIDYTDKSFRESLNLYTVDEKMASLDDIADDNDEQEVSANGVHFSKNGSSEEVEVCLECGGQMINSGSCMTCPTCGATTGCG